MAFFPPPFLLLDFRELCAVSGGLEGAIMGMHIAFLHWAFSVEKFQSGPCFQALLCRGQAKSGKCILEIYASIMPHFRDQSELGSLWILRSSRT